MRRVSRSAMSRRAEFGGTPGRRSTRAARPISVDRRQARSAVPQRVWTGPLSSSCGRSRMMAAAWGSAAGALHRARARGGWSFGIVEGRRPALQKRQRPRPADPECDAAHFTQNRSRVTTTNVDCGHCRAPVPMRTGGANIVDRINACAAAARRVTSVGLRVSVLRRRGFGCAEARRRTIAAVPTSRARRR